ncbi:MAG: tyrosine-protein phosphatase [Candidatus Nanopelagicales bacterium]|nr:tyrosine-protein phosphatase [Candidatus Nanopelagicales bacterium]
MPLDSLPNARDLGGRPGAEGGTIRERLVYRSAALSEGRYLEPLTRLGIGRVFDLRTAGERNSRPDVLPEAARLIVADVLSDDPASGPASLGKIAQHAMTGDDGTDVDTEALRETFRTGYRSFVSMGSARRASREFLSAVADPYEPAILVHCTAGKDRTGWLAALLLLTLGTPWEDVLADYEASAEPVWSLFEPFQDTFLEHGGNLDAIKVALGVFPEYLEASRDQMLTEFGSIDAYLTSGLGLPADFRTRLAARMLTG